MRTATRRVAQVTTEHVKIGFPGEDRRDYQVDRAVGVPVEVPATMIRVEAVEVVYTFEQPGTRAWTARSTVLAREVVDGQPTGPQLRIGYPTIQHRGSGHLIRFVNGLVGEYLPTYQPEAVNTREVEAVQA